MENRCTCFGILYVMDELRVPPNKLCMDEMHNEVYTSKGTSVQVK